jgi:hypothetical protein
VIGLATGLMLSTPVPHTESKHTPVSPICGPRSQQRIRVFVGIVDASSHRDVPPPVHRTCTWKAACGAKGGPGANGGSGGVLGGVPAAGASITEATSISQAVESPPGRLVRRVMQEIAVSASINYSAIHRDNF